MSMPQIPEEKNRPTLCEVTIDILKSVALEETALSHIINAEGERCQAMIKKFECCCGEVTVEELGTSIRQTEKILNTIIMKEWLLLRKLETAFEINQNMVCRDNKEDEKEKDDCRRCNCKCCNCRCCDCKCCDCRQGRCDCRCDCRCHRDRNC